MRNASASLEHLLNHPLLLPPEIRMSSYLNLWIDKLTPDQHNLYNSITSYGKWTSTIPSSQEVLHSILTYNETVPIISPACMGIQLEKLIVFHVTQHRTT